MSKAKITNEEIDVIPGEEWSPVKDFPNYYVSNLGRIRSDNYLGKGVSRIMKPSKGSHGCLRVGMYNGSKQRKSINVHKLVAEAFLDHLEDQIKIIHIDGNKLNNRADNLKWATVSEYISATSTHEERKERAADRCKKQLRKTNKDIEIAVAEKTSIVDKRGIERDVDVNTGQFAQKDYSGQRYEHYEILDCTGRKNSSGNYIWRALCECGNVFEISTSRIGKNKSCGCRVRNNSGQREKADLIGKIVRGFEVISATDKRDKVGNVYWKAVCTECGEEKEYTTEYFTKNAVSCNCNAWIGKYKAPLGKRPLPDSQSFVNVLYNSYKKGAVDRGYVFALTKNEFRNIIEQDCYYCGAKPKERMKSSQCHGEYKANGIDRVDNSEGYVPSNCVPCCSMCNYMKSAFSKQEFLQHVKAIYEHSKLGGDE